MERHLAGSGAVLVALIVFVLLWPLLSRVLRGLGTMFAIYGLMLLLVVFVGGGGRWLHAASLLLGGLALRAVGRFRFSRHGRRPVVVSARHGGAVQVR